jgi:hypothetical protein
MYKLALKFRYALGWAAIGLAVPAVAGAILASALPLLVKDRTVREGLIRSLSEWSGGAVTVNGPLRLASFTSLSVDANDVTFSSTPRLSPLSRIHARTVTAVLRLPALLLGRIEFKKVAVEQGNFVFRRQAAASKFNITGFSTAAEAVARADLSRFERIELRDCSFFIAEDVHRPYERYSAEWAAIASRATAPPFTLTLREHGFEALFRGDIGLSKQKASGFLRLEAPSGHPAAEKIIAAIMPWEKGHGVSLEGNLTWTGSRASLDGADIAFGDHSAKGSLAFGFRHGRALMEGTLAYDKLEWMPSPEEAQDASAGEPLKAMNFSGAGNERTADLDMRISAELVRAGAFEAGPLALALSARGQSVSVDIAELEVFGGTVSGRLDYDYSRPDALTLNATGSRLSSQALTNAVGLPFAASGPVMLRLALDIPLKDKPLAQEIKAAAGSFGIVFPAGGTLDGEAPERLIAAFERQNLPGGAGTSSFLFDQATIEGALAPSGANLNIGAESSGGHVAGSLHIALPGNEVSGTLTLTPGEAAQDAQQARGSPQSASVVLSGTVAALSFSASGKPSLN